MSTTFNTLNDVSKKQRMLFLADSMSSLFSPIAYATSANLSFSADDVDVSNKMDGGWATSMQGKKSAEVSVDALCAYKTGLTSETQLQAGWSSDKLYAFLYIMCTVEEQADGSTKLKYDTSTPFYYGHMKLASLELTSDNGDVAKFSVNGKSQGCVMVQPKGGWLWECKKVQNDIITFAVTDPSGVYVGNQFAGVEMEKLENISVEITGVLASEFVEDITEGIVSLQLQSSYLSLGDKVHMDFVDSDTVIDYTVTKFFVAVAEASDNQLEDGPVDSPVEV